jgi:hypothetical protein
MRIIPSLTHAKDVLLSGHPHQLTYRPANQLQQLSKVRQLLAHVLSGHKSDKSCQLVYKQLIATHACPHASLANITPAVICPPPPPEAAVCHDKLHVCAAASSSTLLQPFQHTKSSARTMAAGDTTAAKPAPHLQLCNGTV